jgi:hypothetical protein
MNVLFLQRMGIDLYRTLLASETSRRILMFYRPESFSGGVSVRVSSFGSALSLASELRWYIRRYMQDVLFEVAVERYCTLGLARELYYDRDFTVREDWPFRRLYVIRNGNLISALNLSALDDTGERMREAGAITRLVVWCSEREYNEEKLIVHGEGPEPGEDITDDDR